MVYSNQHKKMTVIETIQEMEDWEGLCYNNTGFILDTRPSNIPCAGLGLYALQTIPKDTLIGFYEGELRCGKAAKVTDYSFELSRTYFLDACDYPRCYIAMVNDAHGTGFDNNCEFRMVTHDEKGRRLPAKDRRIALFTLRKIRRNEELFAAYGNDYWETRCL
jgi:SET domain-containing protein